MGEGSSSKVWYVVVGLVVLAALAAWYFYDQGQRAPVSAPEASAVEEAQLPALSSGDTAADISADLSQIPDTSAALDADAAAAAAAISGL